MADKGGFNSGDPGRQLFQEFLVPANTAASANGDGPSVGIGAVSRRLFLVTVEIAATVEQEAIEISLSGSKDGATWEPKPLAILPQRFYPGTYPSLVDLTAEAETLFLRAHWELTRWGRGETTPSFCFSVKINEISPEMVG